jgi:23S rRNA (guanosine2251-2'-O)-methyltransferase
MLIYGRNTVIEALKSQFPLESILLQDTLKNEGKISEILSLARKKGVRINSYPLHVLSKELKSEEHQGVGAKVEFSTYKLKTLLSSNSELNSFICIPESTYEQNVGAIIRTAECAGFSGVILNPKIAITPTVAKVSTGAVFHIPIIKESVFQVIKTLRDASFKIVGIERGGELIYNENLEGNILLIIGGEDKSLTPPIIKNCDALVELPQFGTINSLNMSVAAGITIYEVVRQNLSNS